MNFGGHSIVLGPQQICKLPTIPRQSLTWDRRQDESRSSLEISSKIPFLTLPYDPLWPPQPGLPDDQVKLKYPNCQTTSTFRM